MTHLAASPLAVRQQVLQRLGAFESTVFETRVMPRAPPHRALDLDVTLYPGTEETVVNAQMQLAILLGRKQNRRGKGRNTMANNACIE